MQSKKKLFLQNLCVIVMFVRNYSERANVYFNVIVSPELLLVNNPIPYIHMFSEKISKLYDRSFRNYEEIVFLLLWFLVTTS